MARFGFDPGALAPSYGLAESTCAVTVPVPGGGMRVDEIRVDTDAGESIRRQTVLGEAIPGMQVRVNPTDGRTGGIVGREVGEIEIPGAGQVASACQRALGITLARMMKRRQFGPDPVRASGVAHADGRPAGARRPVAPRARWNRRAKAGSTFAPRPR